MYSRAGKSTINQYLAFSSHADSKSSKIMSRRKEKTKLDDEEKELYDLIELEEQHLQKLIQENAITNLGNELALFISLSTFKPRFILTIIN